jgi:hypothetical protein
MIEVKNLSVSYGEKHILEQLNFRIESGEVVGLVGPNGAGKTTLLSTLTGLLTPSEGTIIVADKSLPVGQSLYRVIGFMQDNSVLYPQLTGYDHLQYIALAHGLDKARIQYTAKQVGMISYLDQAVGTYSLGMKQHLLFACAILHQPQVLFLDEPYNGLDPTSLIRIRELIMQLNRKEGMTVLISSHNLDEIDRMTRRIFFVKEGQIIEKTLAQATTSDYLVTVQEVLPTNWERRLSDHSFLVTADQLTNALLRVERSSLRLVEVEPRQFGSEQVYRELFKVKKN